MTGMCLPGSQIRGLSVLSTRDKKGGHLVLVTKCWGKKGVIGYSIATYSVNLNAIVQNGSILRGSAQNFAQIARLRAKILSFGIGYGLDFAKKGVIGYQTVKQGVIRY